MQVTNVQMLVNDNERSRVKATASVTFDDCFIVHDIKIIEGDTHTFIQMPSKKIIVDEKNEYKDVAHPINKSCRAMIQDAVFDKYDEVKSLEELPLAE